MNTAEKTTKLPWHSHVISGWPLVMVIIGGLIGGACGGLAYGASMSLIKKKGISATSYILSTVIGIGCVALYFVVIIGLAIAFPNLFNQ
jgi:hypothetical protein